MISFIGAIALMLWYNWVMTCIVIILCIIPIVISSVVGGKLVETEKNISNINETFVGIVKDLLNGFTVIKSFQAEKQATSLFKQKNEMLELQKYNRKKTEEMINIISAEASFFLQIVVFLIGAYLAIKGMITAGVVIAFVQLMNNILQPIRQLPALLANRKAAKALIQKLAVYVSNNELERGKETISDIGDGIVCKQLVFGYQEENNILKGINLKFERGKSYAIVGGSGSGKSTLLNLLLGSYNNYEGQIEIGGKELREINGESLYHLLSIIQQSVFIFDSSIIDNITMFKEFSQEKIDKVIKYSGLERMIQEKGYDYPCGENGVNLSGGEKQRISIARCLLRNTSILLMDEATAALDAENANAVSNAILNIKGLTRIIVTHNLDEGILKEFDQIIVLKNGLIIEQGKFDELLSKRQYFYSLYNVSKDITN